MGKNQGQGTSQVGNIASCGYLCGVEPQGAVAIVPDAGDANGYD